jgi:hypothetical protein
MQPARPVTVEEERSSSSAALGWALSYAARGMAVLPLRERSKIPATEHGCKDASTDTERIAAWWTANPHANIGVATGAASNLAVLDVDGPEGERSLAELSYATGELFPDTWCSLTGRGAHFWFTTENAPTSNSAGKIGPGLDVRSGGGHICAPASSHENGSSYAFVGEHRKLHPWPEWLKPHQNEPQRAAESLRTYQPGTTGRGDRYAAAALEREAAAVRSAPVGTRNTTLNRAGFSVARFIASGDLRGADVVAALAGAAVAAGLPEREARRTIASAFAARSAA